MLDEATRSAVLRLRAEGHGTRKIAVALGIGRESVKRILVSKAATPPTVARPQLAEPYREQVVELYARCKGNLVRVHEELVATGAELSYAALTHFCRQAQLFGTQKKPAGQYEFGPGEEMQHDTSPHDVVIAGVERRAQTASLALCFSRAVFIQVYRPPAPGEDDHPGGASRVCQRRGQPRGGNAWTMIGTSC